ncbi:MAG: aminotransferase class I/II-fold pyridoxal phosphate-dependent enzyme [Acidobacteriota bacterium]|jgi:methionine-gamma-lyase
MRRFDPVESLAAMRHEFGEHGGVNMSVESSTTFTVLDADTMPEIFQGRRGPESGGCFLYGRHFNPTVYVLGRQMAALEGTEAGYATASGMAAISSTILQIAGHGDHVVSSAAVYGGTFALFKDYLPARAGISTTFVDTTDLEAVEAAFTPQTKLLYVESMTNPTLRVGDLPRLSALAHGRGARLVVDNTFAPLVVSPALHGADVVVHSLTKFINGASDHIAGAICGSTEFLTQLMDLHTGSLMLLGPTMDPTVAFGISMRLPHLGLRMAEHGRRALAFATRLQELGVPVVYPGLPEHPDHAVLKRLANPDYGFGGILCLDLGDVRRANQFMEILQNKDRFGFMAVSLGYFETLMSCSGSTTSSELSAAEQKRAGISPGLVRMSVGITGSLEQRWGQLRDALEILGLVPAGRP